MPGTNKLRLRFSDKIDWYFETPGYPMESGRVALLPVDSESLRKRTIDVLQKLLVEYRQSLDIDRIEEMSRVIGEHLFELAFRDSSLDRLKAELEKIGRKEIDVLRIELEFGSDQEWLSTLPWEYIRTPFEFTPPRHFLVEPPTGVALYRLLKLAEGATARTFQAKQPWTTVVVCCSPRDSGLDDVNSDYVQEVITKLSPAFNLIVVDRTRGGLMGPKQDWVTADRVRQEIRRSEPHIIHFVGHGQRANGVGQLAFEGTDGKVNWVPEEQVANLFAASPNLKLVFLQACESALPNPHIAMSGVAKQVALRNIPAVVAMQDKVQAGVANTFAEGFYKALARNDPVDSAVKAGRDQLNSSEAANQRIGFGLPVLYLRAYGGMLEIGETQEPATRVIPHPSTASVKCPNCGTRMAADSTFCNVCHLRFACPHTECNHKRWANPLAKFCEGCGKRIVQRLISPAAVQTSTKASFEYAPSAGKETPARGTQRGDGSGSAPIEARIHTETKDKQ